MFSEEDKERNNNRNICYDLQEKYNISIEDLKVLVDASIKGWGISDQK